MRGLKILGDYVFEYLILTVLLSISLLLVVPFIPVCIGVIHYFKTSIHKRMLRDIFKAIKDNLKVILIFSVFELLIIIFSGLNIYYFSSHLEGANMLIFGVSCVTLIVGVIFFINAPVIILNMKIRFVELIYNCIILIFGGVKRFVGSLLVTVGFLVVCVFYPYLVPFGLYPVLLVISQLTINNFMILKAKALKTTVRKLNERENEDDYLSEKEE